MAVEWTSSLDLIIDLNPSQGIRQGIETAVRDAIRDGRLRLGTTLPSTRALARDLGVARGTVNEAYSQLAAEGYLLARQGAACRVVWVPPPAEESTVPATEETRHWDLRPGRAYSASFPRQVWAKAVRRVLRDIPDEALGYGDSQGTFALRDALTTYLGRARGVRTDPGRLLVCSGFTQALTVVCGALRAMGATTLATENPNAPRFREIVRQMGLDVVPVPCDEDGLRVDHLAHRSADAVLVTPAHQYPLGGTLSAARRAALVEWARDNDALIIEDDYDGEFRFDRHPVAALQQMDPDHVVYAGTASKTLAPGIRLGWVTLPPAIREAVIAEKDRLDRGNSVLDQFALAELIGSGEFDRHVRRMRVVYRQRRDQVLDVLAERVPELQVRGIAAGLHLVAVLPGMTSEEQVLAEAERNSLLLHSLTEYWHEPDGDRPQAVIVGYGTPAGHAFRPALQALASAVSAAMVTPRRIRPAP
ncbi:PLP-dependent aminotransferase family protein [Micromonospora sp. NPDC049559]|uniref:MocR-like pyridoxine biosynthesis transcription factor PdxR n=1 Tax=Micromonospora sp. NPDC049559 TaxID=3155923 RepID=UPI00343D612E